MKNIDEIIDEERDGSFTHHLAYSVSKRAYAAIKICNPDLIDYDVGSAQGHSFVVDMPSAANNCIIKNIVVEPGRVELRVRTSRREVNLQVSTSFISTAPAGGAITAISVSPPPSIMPPIIPVIPLIPTLVPITPTIVPPFT